MIVIISRFNYRLPVIGNVCSACLRRNRAKIAFSCLIIGKNLRPRPLWESPTPNGPPRRCMSSSSLVRAQIKRKRALAVSHMVQDLSVSVYATRNRCFGTDFSRPTNFYVVVSDWQCFASCPSCVTLFSYVCEVGARYETVLMSVRS